MSAPRGKPKPALAGFLVLLLAPAAGCKDRPPPAYEFGKDYLENGELEDAIVCFDEAMRAAPRMADVYYQRGLAYYNKGQAFHAQRDLDRAFLNNDRAIFELENALRLNGRHAQAAALSEQARKNSEIYKREFDADRAIDLATEELRESPAKAVAHDRRGCAYVRRGDFQDDPADYDRAIEDFTAAVLLDPSFVQAWYNRATVMMFKGQQAHGSGDHRAMLEEDPTDSYRQAVCYYDRSIADFSRAAQLDPSLVEPLGSPVAAAHEDDDLVLARRYDGAIADFEPSPMLCPRIARAYYLRGDAQLKLGNFREAAADFREAIRLYPRFAEAYANRAFAYEGLGDDEKAEADRSTAGRLGSMF